MVSTIGRPVETTVIFNVANISKNHNHQNVTTSTPPAPFLTYLLTVEVAEKVPLRGILPRHDVILDLDSIKRKVAWLCTPRIDVRKACQWLMQANSAAHGRFRDLYNQAGSTS